MRTAAKMLGWTARILLVFLAIFAVTTFYSAFQIIFFGKGLGFTQQPEMRISEGVIAFTYPFYVNNTGFYDISDLNITAIIADGEGRRLTSSYIFLPLIPPDNWVEENFTLFLSLEEMSSEEFTRLLTQDEDLLAELSIGLKFAHAFAFQLQIPDITLPWRAPLQGLSIKETAVTANETHHLLTLTINSENHSPFPIEGIIRLEAYDPKGNLLGVGEEEIKSPPGSIYTRRIDIAIPKTVEPLEIEEFRIYVETPTFLLGPVVISYG